MKRHEESKRKPILVKRGNTTVKIYQGKSRGYDLFTVVHYSNGQRQRETFGKLENAKTRAEEVATLSENGRRDVLELSSADRESYVHAMRSLARRSISPFMPPSRSTLRRVASLATPLSFQSRRITRPVEII